MDKKIWFGFSVKDFIFVALPIGIVILAALVFAVQHLDPAPPSHLVISTGDDESDLKTFAEDYKSILKQDGVDLQIKSSTGPFENLHRLEDDSSGVSAAFVQDGLGSAEAQPDVVSLGSLYYEPIWVFYRAKNILNHFSELEGKKIAVGKVGHGTQVIAQRLLKLSGVDPSDATLINIDSQEAARALKAGEVDAALFMMQPEDPILRDLILQKDLRLMNVAQAEAISRKDPAFHHLVLPRGALDLNEDAPATEVNLVSTTATLLVRDDLHPALAYLLLKAAAQVHSNPGIFERRGEFPTNKDDVFPLSEDAIQFYKSGGPFWQRYLPYWLAALLDRFILLVIPVLALVLPLLRLIPRLYNWKLRSRIYQRYGELKFLETQINERTSAAEHDRFLKQLDGIEERVNKMKMPANFAEYIYSLKGHIQFVRDRLEKTGGSQA